MPGKNSLLAVAGILLAATAVGCPRDRGLPDRKPPGQITGRIPPHIRSTVAEYAILQGAGQMPVRGWGVVVGLGRNGSSEVPDHLKEYLQKVLYRDSGLGSPRAGTGAAPASRVLRDRDTAVVEIIGTIPAGATVGSKIDLFVRALPHDQTRSLEGGVLLLTDLRLPVGGKALAGRGSRAYATGHGQVFTNPFLDPTRMLDQDKLRRGRLIGGGRVALPRVLRLQLREANFRQADIIQRRINERWSRADNTPVAKARNRYAIDLAVPDEFAERYSEFIKLVMRLPIHFGQRRWIQHAQDIAREMEAPEAEYEDLALVWEAMGRQALPAVSKLYKSRVAGAAFYAARTGMRLDDGPAATIVQEFARRAGSPFQIPAIEELARHRAAPVGKMLTELLDSGSELVRLAAYRALVRRGGSIAVRRMSIGGRFDLDVVACKGQRVVYAMQTDRQRIVLFGGADMTVARPMFLTTPGGLVTINAGKATGKLTVYRKLPRSGRSSKPFAVAPRVLDLIGTLGLPAKPGPDKKIMGLGLTYSQVVMTLYHLCRAGDIKAKFVLQPAPGMEQALRAASTRHGRDMPGS